MQQARQQQWVQENMFLTAENIGIPFPTNGSTATPVSRTFEWGQLKLLTVELWWIVTNYRPNMKIICAGVQTGSHFRCLVDMLPADITFDCWDERDNFQVKNYSPRITYYDRDLTTEDCLQKYHGQQNLFFMSDIYGTSYAETEYQWREMYGINTRLIVIRANDYLGNPKFELTAEQIDEIHTGFLSLTNKQMRVLFRPDWEVDLTPSQQSEVDQYYSENSWNGDSKLQEQLLLALDHPNHPVWSALLKFKAPFPSPNLQSVHYFDGYILKQPFTAATSSECRLIPTRDSNGNYKYRNYDLTAIEEKMYYYNTRVREDTPGQLPVAWLNTINQSSVIEDQGQLKNSFDACYLLYVLDTYMYSLGDSETNPQIRYERCLAAWRWIHTHLDADGKVRNLNVKRHFANPTERVKIGAPTLAKKKVVPLRFK